MSILKNYFIYSQRTIDNDLKKYRINVTSYRKELKTNLEEYNIDSFVHQKDFDVILSLFLLISHEWDVLQKASLHKEKERLKDHKRLKILFDAFIEGDTIKTFKITTKKKITLSFNSDVFQIYAGDWLYNQKKSIDELSQGNFFKNLEKKKPETKPTGKNSYMIDHAYTFIFWQYLKDVHPRVKNKSIQFIADFLRIIYPKSPSAKKISKGLNTLFKKQSFIPSIYGGEFTSPISKQKK